MAERDPCFDPHCRECPRLADFLAQGRARYPDYHCAPVAPFGAAAARLLIVGLAPGFHGANATGRPFTGDHAGLLLYRTLHRFGFADRAESRAVDDGLRLIDCRITNAVKCVPPANRPLPAEVRRCNVFLAAELSTMPAGSVLLALGAVAHAAILQALGLRASTARFGHGEEHELPDNRLLVDSYHCSRYNTQTRRLTEDMFEAIFSRVRFHLDQAA